MNDLVTLPSLASITSIDVSIVVVYLLAMLGIGIYYSLRMNNSDDYLLGGRRMASTSVGMSLFASMLSTISFLGWPGEIIRHGPTILSQVIAYPIVFVVVGWFLIPRIMRYPVTSAYEILELKLGKSARYLASCMFVLLRTLWMAVVVYATIHKVIVPVFDLPASSTPWLCAVLGVVTVVYSVLGGLRAVVMTDVIQTLILLMGAVVSLVIISYNLGGLSEIFPTSWPDHWSVFRVNFHWSDRTVLGFLLNFICWYIATMGSDQMAIQRFLATPTEVTARRVLRTSLCIDGLVFCFMGLVGLALMSWFTSNPSWLADGESVFETPDRLFPRFITIGLPVGLTGIVVAGLMSAAMSSLSSGVNSTAAVISTDWMQGILGWKLAPTQQLVAARVSSAVMGAVVVLLSTFMQYIEGNLFELTVRVANLMTGPLFVLFFMTMFVPRASAATAIAAALTAMGVAASISFSQKLDIPLLEDISFLWMLPVSLAIGIVVGAVLSLVFPALPTAVSDEP
ncbi:sodium:solute symporter family transporter [Aeoliella mucimassa]|uniref:Sodium/glucose cotransporter n=1 Tax=Aeoliella mucimassa TaxID=2527972 RepID=A0A518AQ79_9BACT|nr:sodium/solute symporter [Aeoliella mucimassa]QDU56876.1 Sodium/glucose cotransporter [Aeoliella mucimassa]